MVSSPTTAASIPFTTTTIIIRTVVPAGNTNPIARTCAIRCGELCGEPRVTHFLLSTITPLLRAPASIYADVPDYNGE